MMRVQWLLKAHGILFLLLFSLPAFGQTKSAFCDSRLGLIRMTPTGYTKSRWQDALDPEGDKNSIQSKEVHRVLRLGKNAVPLLIGCLTDARSTKAPVWDYWPETKVGDIAFVILCDLFSDPSGASTLDAKIDWGDVQAESPDQPAWIAWANYNAKHGRLYVQQTWQRTWAENSNRIYWDDFTRCFRMREGP
jgi:hypothetical protein